jgi:SAM-dependent methyltransferase
MVAGVESPSISVDGKVSDDRQRDRSRIPYDSCPLCNNASIRLHHIGNCSHHLLYHPSIPAEIRWFRCEGCSHVFTEGYYTDEALQIIFRNTNPMQKAGYNFEQQRYVSARMVEKVAPYAKPGAWLDVGFGNGSLLFTAEEWGFQPVGLDLRESTVEGLRLLGVEAYCEDIATFQRDVKFSVISMADVLEHIPFPKVALEAAHRLLDQDGVLFVSMPNFDCSAWRLLDRDNANPYWGELEHYHNFSRSRLYELLQEMNFEPVRYGVSERYRVCMEVVAKRRNSAS